MGDDILHFRLVDFELQVERLLDSSLRTRPVAIISSHHPNGTIVVASAEAISEGLYPGLKVSLARRMAHSVILLPYNSTLYARVHHYIFQAISRYSPLIEPTVFGQFFADLTGMQGIYGNSLRAGYLLAKDIQNRVSLQGHIGISINKLVSQITTAVVPETIYRVIPGEEATFLAPLATEVLPTIHESTVAKITHFLLLHRVKDIQQVTADSEAGTILFGKYFRRIYQESRGQDNTPVRPPQKREHITEQTVLVEDTNDEEQLFGAIRTLAEQVAYQLRLRRQVTKSLTVEIHYSDGFKSQRRGGVAANDDAAVIAEATNLFMQANYRRNRVRALILDAANLQPVMNQLDLFQAPKDLNLSRAVDRIRQKYGAESIGSAVGLSVVRKDIVKIAQPKSVNSSCGERSGRDEGDTKEHRGDTEKHRGNTEEHGINKYYLSKPPWNSVSPPLTSVYPKNLEDTERHRGDTEEHRINRYYLSKPPWNSVSPHLTSVYQKNPRRII